MKLKLTNLRATLLAILTTVCLTSLALRRNQGEELPRTWLMEPFLL